MSKNFKAPFNPMSINKFDVHDSLIRIAQKITLDSSKFFLECYQTSKNTSHINKDFIKECPLYSKESIIPDSHQKMKNPYNRNLAFYIRHGPMRNYNNYFHNMKKNYFPKYPMKLSPFCELEMKTHGFTKNFEVKKVVENEEEKVEEKNEINISENKFDEKLILKELKIEDIFGLDFNDIKKENLSIGHYKYDVNIKIPGKLWNFKVCTKDKSNEYGPYLTEFVYNFLKSYYLPLKEANHQFFSNYSLLVTDTISDVHYLPEMLVNILDKELESNEKDKNSNKGNNEQKDIDNYFMFNKFGF